MAKKLPEPEDVQAKADALIEKSGTARKVREHLSWPGIVLFGTVLVLIFEAIINRVLLA